MKIQLGKLYACSGILQKLSGAELKAKTAWYLLQLLKQVQTNIDEFEKIKSDKITKYGTKDDNGNIVLTQDNEKFESIRNELDDLLSAEVEITFNKIKLEELEEIKIGIGELAAIEWLIEE